VPGIFCFQPKTACWQRLKTKKTDTAAGSRDWLKGHPKPDHANNPPPTSDQELHCVKYQHNRFLNLYHFHNYFTAINKTHQKSRFYLTLDQKSSGSGPEETADI
jgi:hypothetical protein